MFFLYVISFDSSVVRPYDCALMLTEPLPNLVDVRKLVQKGTQIRAELPVSQLPRFSGLLANTEGSVTTTLRFFIDEQKIRRVDGDIYCKAFAICQRCMEILPLSLESHFELAVVKDDEQARQLPDGLDPLIVTDDYISLADVVEEELILCLPIVNYHDDKNCQEVLGATADQPDLPLEQPTDSPFKVLESLKSSNV